MRLLFLLCFCCFLLSTTHAQNEWLTVDSIQLVGNKRTKDRVILRELDFKPGDKIKLEELMPRLKVNELRVLNTGLFNLVRLNVGEWDGQNVIIKVELTEAWYVYPFPIFGLADRNFNVWWVEQNHSFKRVNYGLEFSFNNLSGNNDELEITTQLGYTQKFEAEYGFPGFNKKQTLSIFGNIFYSRNREVPYVTNQNTLDFHFDEDAFNLKKFRLNAEIGYRPGLNTFHTFNVFYHNKQITDTIASLNPDFFGDSNLKQQYIELEYKFRYQGVQILPYPEKGIFFETALQKQGIGIFKGAREFSITSTCGQFTPLGKGFYLSNILRGKLSFFKQKPPYFELQNALGYEENFLRGYEYYVIDGQDFAYNKTSLRYKLLDKNINMSRYLPFDAYKVIPLKIFLNWNNDLGYVRNEYYGQNNPLNNQILWGWGPSLDLIVLYEYVLQFEYSFNHLNEHGFFFHLKYSL